MQRSGDCTGTQQIHGQASHFINKDQRLVFLVEHVSIALRTDDIANNVQGTSISLGHPLIRSMTAGLRRYMI